MGLDITALINLQPSDEDNGRHVYINPDFAAQADGLQEGYYDGKEVASFRAGSYSGYNHWRDQLAILAGYAGASDCWDRRRTEGPFYELINFSDAEGAIGPKTSAKLAGDFDAFAEKASQCGDEYFIEKYLNWQAAFRAVADAGNGAVCFH